MPSARDIPPFILRLSCTLLCLAGLATLPPPLHAAETPPAREAAARSFDIAPGPLSEVLARYAASAGVALSFDAASLRNIQSPGLKGSYTVQRGFDRLLAGSGMAAVPRGQGDYALKTVPRISSDAKESQLSAVTVTADTERDGTTEGSGSYATRSTNTATGLALSPRETPQSVSIITRQEMDDFNLSTIHNVLQSTPGIGVTTVDNDRYEYTARGFFIRNYQYDGMPAFYQSGYSGGQDTSDMAMYDRVEVLKGAAGLMDSSGDPGATINLIRKKPTHTFQGHASTSLGSWNDRQGELDLSGPLNEAGTVRARAVASVRDRDSHVDRYSKKSQMVYGVIEADLSAATLLTVGADWQDTTPKGSANGGIPLFDSNGNFTNMPRSFNPGARWSSWSSTASGVFATLEHQFDNDWKLKLHTAHRSTEHDDRVGAIAGGNPNPAAGTGAGMWLGRYEGGAKEDSVDFQASGSFQWLGRQHELVLGGGSYRRDWHSDNSGPEAGYAGAVGNFYQWTGDVPEPLWTNSYGRIRYKTREHALYGTLRLNPHDDLKLLLGARAMRHDSLTDQFWRVAPEKGSKSVFIPYAGVVYDLTPQLSAYASYTTIFKPQTAQDVTGRTLDPMEGNNVEVGLKGEFFDKRLNASLALFQVDQDNYANSTGAKAPSGNPAYEAVDGVKTRGWELEAVGHLTPQWQVHAGFTHKVARRDGNKTGTDVPENQITLRSSYRFGGDLAGLTLGGGARWQSKAWADIWHGASGSYIAHTASGYTVLDLMGSYQFSPKLSASLNVTNLLDRKYHSMYSYYGTYAWGEPRRVAVNLKYRF
ncbi:MAG: TonB-dependent siderophore receptor [Rhodocyclaceae bacterium]|nr:TonB-dependent siderophore receptor [Rhodocyclaceae bacterium]